MSAFGDISCAYCGVTYHELDDHECEVYSLRDTIEQLQSDTLSRYREMAQEIADQESTIEQLQDELVYWKGRVENGANAEHWSEFGPSGGGRHE